MVEITFSKTKKGIQTKSGNPQKLDPQNLNDSTVCVVNGIRIIITSLKFKFWEVNTTHKKRI